MKRITLIILLTFGFSNAQFFEAQQEEPSQERSSGFFGNDVPAAPEQSQDERDPFPNNPGTNPAPIDNWLFLLPMAGIAIGVYWLRKKSKLTA